MIPEADPIDCIGDDPFCPCNDGDACHYRTYGASPAMPWTTREAAR